MSMEYIRTYYRVPAKRGGRVIYTGSAGARQGTITGSRGARILIRLDGEPNAMVFHPTWQIEYLVPTPSEDQMRDAP